MDTISSIRQVLEYQDIDAWMLVNAENKDPFYTKYVTRKTNALSIAIISSNDFVVFAHNLDAENLLELEDKGAKIVNYNSESKIDPHLINYLQNDSKLNRIALNYSNMADVSVDVLGHGMYEYLVGMITENVTHITRDNFISAESIIYSLVDRKSSEELNKMRIAAVRANEILMDTFELIRPGMTELDLVDLVHEVTEKSTPVNSDNGIVSEEYAWEEALCPIALTGPSFLKGGHAVSSDQLVEEGSTVYFDFGVKLTFKDGSKWSSDIQRTGYVLRKDEKKPPPDILKRFEDIINSITVGIEEIHPGMKGFEADQIVRGYLQDRDYKDYDHATGHAIGETAHNPGTVLSMRQEGRSQLLIQPNGVYTLEPRVPVTNGVSIEEMVVFYEDKHAESLSPRQLEPILIKN